MDFSRGQLQILSNNRQRWRVLADSLHFNMSDRASAECPTAVPITGGAPNFTDPPVVPSTGGAPNFTDSPAVPSTVGAPNFRPSCGSINRRGP